MEHPMYCVKCKAQVNPAASFCHKCGADQRSPSRRPVPTGTDTVPPRTCKNCQGALGSSDPFCSKCGADQRDETTAGEPPGMKPCPTCGREVSVRAKTCPHCAEPLAAVGFAKTEKRVDWLLTLLFGCFYFLWKGWYKAALVSLGIALLTGGLSWLIIAFFAQDFVDRVENW